MNTIKSIITSVSLGYIITLLGNLLVLVSFGIGGESTKMYL